MQQGKELCVIFVHHVSQHIDLVVFFQKGEYMLKLMAMIGFSNQYLWCRQLPKSFIQEKGVGEQNNELKKLPTVDSYALP